MLLIKSSVLLSERMTCVYEVKYIAPPADPPALFPINVR